MHLSCLVAGLVVFFVQAENKMTADTGLLKDTQFSTCLSKNQGHCEDFATDSILTGMSMHANIIHNTIHKPKEDERRPRNCADLFHKGDNSSGIRTIYPFVCCETRDVLAFCDQTTDGGGWTVIQHRDALPKRENFFRNWVEYEIGFGKPDGEYWLGLKNIHALVSTNLMELRVDLEDFEGVKRWAKYEYFYVGDLQTKYHIEVGAYSGTAGDSLSGEHNGNRFSTKDRDHDLVPDENCASNYHGAWWYGANQHSNLNGFQYEKNRTSYSNGIIWKAFRGRTYSLKATSLAVRPKF